MTRHGVVLRQQVLGLLWQGLSAREVSRVSGVDPKTIGRWVKHAGMVSVVGRRGGVAGAGAGAGVGAGSVRSGGRLCLADRAVIQVGLGKGLTIRGIAAELGVAPSTVSREVRAHQVAGVGYVAGVAEGAAVRARARPKARKLDQNLVLRGEVVARLTLHHSPRQVSRRLRKDFPDREDMRVSHETIYQALYVQGRGSLRKEVAREKVLRSGRTKRVPRSKLSVRPQSAWIGPEAMITQRPAEADDRAVPGHWEGDLVLGKPNGSALITLVERAGAVRWFV